MEGVLVLLMIELRVFVLDHDREHSLFLLLLVDVQDSQQIIAILYHFVVNDEHDGNLGVFGLAKVLATNVMTPGLFVKGISGGRFEWSVAVHLVHCSTLDHTT